LGYFLSVLRVFDHHLCALVSRRAFLSFKIRPILIFGTKMPEFFLAGDMVFGIIKAKIMEERDEIRCGKIKNSGSTAVFWSFL